MLQAGGTSENHQLLERVYFLRAQQLVQEGMSASAVRGGAGISLISV